MRIIERHQTDWLGSNPVFYNQKTGKISRHINQVIDFSNLEFDPEGLADYLDFGYSVFGYTMVKDVRVSPPASELRVHEDGTIEIINLEDPSETEIDSRRSEAEVMELLVSKVQAWEKSVTGPIVVPTSGGYDSRLLNFCLQDKSRIRSFSYGLSGRQSASFEVVYARELAQRLGTSWEQVELGDFHEYFGAWDDLFGPAVHAHGMYQMEFYDKIRRRLGAPGPLLSGIIGDAWAGSVKIPPLTQAQDVLRLGYSHGMHSDSRQSLLPSAGIRRVEYFKKNKERLQDERVRVIEAMRFKMALLQYLVSVPEHYGFQPYSPFLDPDVALSMLNLPADRRKDRLWQEELFRKNGLDVERPARRCSRRNTLNYQGVRRHQLEPLRTDLLKELMNQDYLDWVNGHIGLSWSDRMIFNLAGTPKVGGLLKRLGVVDSFSQAYFAYLVLKPIESLLLKRRQA